MKKLYLAISVSCLASMGAMAQTLTFTNPSGSGKCDGFADFSPGSVTSWVWKKDSVVIQTNGTHLDSLCVGHYFVSFNGTTGNVVKPFDMIVNTTTNPGTSNNSPVTPHGQSVASVCDGYATFTPGGTTAWKWYKGSVLIQTNGTMVDSLCGGDYCVEFLDSAGVNIIKHLFTIGVGSATGTGSSGGSGTGTCPGFESHAVTTNEITAAGCDGTAEIVIVRGGTAPFTYKWAGSNLTTKTRSALCRGAYSFTVTDNAGCTYTDSAHVYPMNAANPCANYKVHVLGTNESSPGACDGSAEAFADGGVAPFTYHWGNSNITTKIHPSLCSGKQIVKVVDANGCAGVDSTILGALALNTSPCQFFNVRTLVINDTSHTAGIACGGYVEAICRGGRGPLTFVWAGNASNTTPFYHNACQGNYTVTVSDSAGCSVTMHTFVGMNQPPIMAPMPPAPGIMPLHIFVRTADVTNGSLCNGMAKAVAQGGTPPYTYTFGGATGTGGFYQIDSLCAGFYTIDVMDADSSRASFVFVIGSPATTFMPPPPLVPPTVPPVILDTLVASAVPTCVIDYDAIDSIRITAIAFVPGDTLQAVWTIFQSTGGNHLFTQFYPVDTTSGIVHCVLDLFCTNRASGSAKAQDEVDLGKVATGIQDIGTINTNVFPNPFSNQLSVTIGNNSTISIFDITGRNVYNGTVNTGTTTINTNQLNPGMYFVNITNGSNLFTRKLIKR